MWPRERTNCLGNWADTQVWGLACRPGSASLGTGENELTHIIYTQIVKSTRGTMEG